MLSLDAVQTSLVNASDKIVTWAFYIYNAAGTGYSFVTNSVGGMAWDTGLAWDTGFVWDDGLHLSSVLVLDFNGITLTRNKSEQSIIAPSDLTFSLSNPDNVLTHTDFTGGEVFVELYLSNETYGQRKITGWRFNIKSCEPGYQKLKFTCEDFMQKYLRGDYPNTPLPEDLFPSTASYESGHKGLCVPVPFGTAYVPLRSIPKSDAHTLTSTGISSTASANGSRCKIAKASGLDIFIPNVPITMSGWTAPATANNGTFTPLSVSATEIEFDTDDGIVTKAAGDTVVLTQMDVYFILGDPAYTYAIDLIRAPRVYSKDQWTLSATLAPQTTLTDADADTWRAFQPYIVDLDLDGINESIGYFKPSDTFLDAPVRFTRSDTITTTSPEDVIQFVLEDMGVPTARIDSTSFAAAGITYASWGLTFNGAFWYKQPREKVLSQLLTMCHSCLRVGEKIELYVLSKTSQKTITAAEVMRTVEQGEGTFKWKDTVSQNYSNCGYVAWQQSGQAQDQFLKALVPAKSLRTNISAEVLECPFVQDSQKIQKIGTLHYQRKLLKKAEITFDGMDTLPALQPDDIITMNNGNYGGSYAALVNSVNLRKDLIISFSCSVYSDSLDDWTDLSPTALTVPTDNTKYIWQPAIAGPQTDQLDIGSAAFDVWGKEWLTVGPIAGRGKFTDLQKALNAVNQAGGGAIYILNGTYQQTAILYVPNVNLEIIGQSQGGVILKNLAASNLFVLHNLSKKYSFNQFSIESQNVASFTYMFYFYGDTDADNVAELNIKNISGTLQDDGSSTGDDFLFGSKGQTGKIILKETDVVGGDSLAKIFTKYNSSVEINNCRGNSSLLGLYVNADIIGIKDNVFTDILTTVIQTVNMSQGNVESNRMSGDFLYGIRVSAFQNLIVKANQIYSTHSTGTAFAGISASSSGSKSIIEGNRVVAEMAANVLAAYGISVSSFSDGVIKGNIVKINNSNTTSYHYGIVLFEGASGSNRNVVAGNSIDMINNDAKDIGIQLNNNCDNNQGGDNVTYNCGVGIDDTLGGTGNAVTGKDV